jgi:hypothetical protein
MNYFFAFGCRDIKFGTWLEFWNEPVLFWKVVSGEAPGLSAMAIQDHLWRVRPLHDGISYLSLRLYHISLP